MHSSANAKLACLLFAILCGVQSTAQNGTCPPNIGFENGNFQGWECYIGKIQTDGNLTLFPSPPMDSIHSIFQKSLPQQLDKYGLFPVNSPNGSSYSLRLGDDNTGSNAERVTYTFTIPANQNNYSFIYHYAVVFQDPNHTYAQQPKFASQLFDIDAGSYVQCGSFDFVASAGLPDFHPSHLGGDVYYKTWSPITINLNGYAGKTMRLEFTTNDCSLGGHFGYAYIDVDESCTSPITGNMYCAGANALTLRSPFGFREYRWYNADFTQMLGSANTLIISPPPPHNTVFALEVIPYPGLGCLDTLYTTVNALPDLFTFKSLDSVFGCQSPGVNLTLPAVTAGSTPGLHFSYFEDQLEVISMIDPQHVKETGTYYIKAVNNVGCMESHAVDVRIFSASSFLINNPDTVCSPATVDITSATITAGNIAGLIYTYWKDVGATIPLTSPQAIAQTGTYYIRAVSAGGCVIVKGVKVAIADLIITPQTGCGSVNLTLAKVTNGTIPGFMYSYWDDPACTVPIFNATDIKVGGSYYIKAERIGCAVSKQVNVIVHMVMNFLVTDPAPVVFPETVDITKAAAQVQGVSYTYWRDSLASKTLPKPQALTMGGTFFIKGTGAEGCYVTKSVRVNIGPPPEPKVIAPNAFSPNGDGINETFKPILDGLIDLRFFRIYNRWGGAVYETSMLKPWSGTMNSKPLPVGTYYWILEGINKYNREKVMRHGSITLLR